MPKKWVVCDKCRRHFDPGDIIKGNHGKLCRDCYPIVKEAHSITYYKLCEMKQRESKNVTL